MPNRQGWNVTYGIMTAARLAGVTMTSAASAATLRITCYSDGVECEVTQKLAQRFTAANPDVQITIDKVAYKAIQENLPVQLAAGNGPDIARVTDFRAIAKYFLDMRPLLPDVAYWETNFGSTLPWMQTGPADHGIFGLPTQLTITGPIVNETLFEQAGIPLPGPTATWDDWAAATAEVAKATKTEAGMAKPSPPASSAGTRTAPSRRKSGPPIAMRSRISRTAASSPTSPARGRCRAWRNPSATASIGRSRPGRSLVLLLILAKLMVPPTVVLVPNYLIASSLGLTNSLWGVIWPGVATPTGVLRRYMLTIPDELLDAAHMDHATEWRLFWRIVLPLSAPALAVLAIFSVMWRWNDFLLPMVVLNRSEKFTLQLALNAEAARMLRLEDYLDRRPTALSGGQRQRVAIGRAIVREPRIFLFDEPLSNLDAELRVDMRGELTQLHRRPGATMIYVTHDQVEAMTMADKIVVLRAGRVEQVGPPLTLYNHPLNEFVAGFIGSPRMNFMPGHVTDAGVAVAGLGIVAVSRPGLAAGTPVTLGIRPEHVQLEPGGTAAAVETIEQLGGLSYNYHGLYRGYEAQDGDLDYYVMLGPRLAEVTPRFLALTGHTALVPRWTLGFAQTAMAIADVPAAQARMEQFIDLCAAKDVPISSFHMGSGYTSIGIKRYVFNWNNAKFPDPAHLMRRFHAAGMHVVANLKPCLLDDHPNYADAATSGAFVQDGAGAPRLSQFWDGEGAHIDFTSQAGND